MHSDARESFRENGFLFPVQFLNEEEKIFYENKYNEYAKIYGSSVKGDETCRIRGNKIFRLHIAAKWAADLVRHPLLIQTVSQILDTPNLLIWSSDLAVKPANSTQCFGWHQDEAYAHLGPEDKLLTAWIAFSDSNSNNGCVSFIRGSHKLGQLAHKSQARTPEQNLVLGQVVADQHLIEDLAEDVINCEIKVGEASLHAWRTIHSSKPNQSDKDRIGLAVRYMAADVIPSQSVVKELVTLASGNYSGEHFEIEDVPKGNYGKAEWALHKKSMEREWERRKKSKELGLLPSHQYETKNS